MVGDGNHPGIVRVSIGIRSGRNFFRFPLGMVHQCPSSGHQDDSQSQSDNPAPPFFGQQKHGSQNKRQSTQKNNQKSEYLNDGSRSLSENGLSLHRPHCRHERHTMSF